MILYVLSRVLQAPEDNLDIEDCRGIRLSEYFYLEEKLSSEQHQHKNQENKYGTVQELRSTFSHTKSSNIDFCFV